MAELLKFRRKPETVEAIQYDGTEESRGAILLHFPDAVTVTPTHGVLMVDTGSGRSPVSRGDWVIRRDVGRVIKVTRLEMDHDYSPVVPVRMEPDSGCCE